MEIRLKPELEAAVALIEEARSGLEAAWQEAERGELSSLEDVRLEMEAMKAQWRTSR
jgi:hypothetical protein